MRRPPLLTAADAFLIVWCPAATAYEAYNIWSGRPAWYWVFLLLQLACLASAVFVVSARLRIIRDYDLLNRYRYALLRVQAWRVVCEARIERGDARACEAWDGWGRAMCRADSVHSSLVVEGVL